MKKTFRFLFAAVAVLAAASCTKEFVETAPVAEGEMVTFKVALKGNPTKTEIVEGKTVWAAGDKILFTDGTAKVEIAVPADFEGKGYAELSFESTALKEADTVYAVYPPVAYQSAAGGVVSLKVLADQSGEFNEANLCVAMSTGDLFELSNATAVMKFTVPDGIESVVLSAASKDTLAGKLAVTCSTDNPISVEASAAQTTIKVATAGMGGEYYVAVVPGTYTEFSLVALCLNGRSQTKSTTNKTLAINDLADLGVIGDNLKGTPFKGSGTESDPFQIKNLGDITSLATNVGLGLSYEGQYFRLERDITDVTTPIGYYDAENNADYYFKGTFDGNRKTVTVNFDDPNGPTKNSVGLFGDLGDGACVHDVTVAGVVKGTSNVGGVVGCLNSGKNGVTIKNCTNNATVSGTTQVAGIAGYADASEANVFVVDGCINNGAITGTSTRVAGILGISTTAKTKSVKNCVNNGNVTGGNNVAGIIGYSYYNKVEGCVNNGKILASADEATCVYALVGNTFKYPASTYTNGVGGIAGWTQNESVVNCTNTGEVEGYVKIGGICGVNYWCSVIDCNNSGNIKGRGEYAYNWASQNGMNYGSMAGGIVGWLNGAGNILRCNNSGSITGKSGIGGIAGLAQTGTGSSTPSIQNCKNTGAISANGTVGGNAVSNASTGGIVGLAWNHSSTKYLKVTSCENSAKVTNTGRIAGGIIGMLYDANNAANGFVDKCVNTGDVSALFYVGGIVGFDRSRATSGGGTVRNCENHGTVTGTRTDDAGECAGGIVGANNGSSKHFIYNCYNDGDVYYAQATHVKPYCGGIIGQCTATAGSLIQNCYNAGYVGPLGNVEVAEGANASLGGIVGNHGTANILSNSYALSTACAQLVGTGSKAVGENVASFDDGGLFETVLTVNSKDCANLFDALNAWVNGASTYYPWAKGELFPEFSK